MSNMNTPSSAMRTEGQRLKDDLGRVGESVGVVKDELLGLSRDAVDAAKTGVAVARDQAARGVEKAKEHGEEAIETLSEFVTNRPLASLGIAVGVGIVLGMLMCRPRS